MIKRFVIPEKAHREIADKSNLSFAFTRGFIKVIDIPEKVISLYVPDTGGKLYSVDITRTSEMPPESRTNDNDQIPLSSLGDLIKMLQIAGKDPDSPNTDEVIVDITDDTIRLEIYDDYRE